MSAHLNNQLYKDGWGGGGQLHGHTYIIYNALIYTFLTAKWKFIKDPSS